MSQASTYTWRPQEKATAAVAEEAMEKVKEAEGVPEKMFESRLSAVSAAPD